MQGFIQSLSIALGLLLPPFMMELYTSYEVESIMGFIFDFYRLKKKNKTLNLHPYDTSLLLIVCPVLNLSNTIYRYSQNNRLHSNPTNRMMDYSKSRQSLAFIMHIGTRQLFAAFHLHFQQLSDQRVISTKPSFFRALCRLFCPTIIPYYQLMVIFRKDFQQNTNGLYIYSHNLNQVQGLLCRCRLDLQTSKYIS